jgi:hypothetical protein
VMKEFVLDADLFTSCPRCVTDRSRVTITVSTATTKGKAERTNDGAEHSSKVLKGCVVSVLSWRFCRMTYVDEFPGVHYPAFDSGF